VIATTARPFSSARPLLLVLGSLVALASFLGVFLVGTIATRGGGTARELPVVVAARDIDAREVIKPEDLTVTALPAASVPPAGYTNTKDVTGATAMIRILKGQPVTTNLTSRTPDQTGDPAPAFLPIPKGSVAVTIPTSEQQGVAGYIAAGDYINVVATVNTGQFSAFPAKTVSKIVLAGAHVIRLGPPGGGGTRDGQRIGLSSSLTIVVSQCDAAYLNWLVGNASLRYELLAYQDYPSGAPSADQSCPNIAAGLGPAQIDARYSFTRI